MRSWFRQRGRAENVRALVLGIGNPGKQYAGTRHNVGFAVIDELRSRWGARSRGKKHAARLWADGEVLLAKPQTFVNRSGLSARMLCGSFHLDPADVLVVADDVNLRLGQLRLRRQGSAGGHKGLRSVIGELGTDEVPRLRLGVDRPADVGGDLVEHVLSPFPSDQEEAARECLRRAADCVEVWLAEGIEAAMNQFNT